MHALHGALCIALHGFCCRTCAYLIHTANPLLGRALLDRNPIAEPLRPLDSVPLLDGPAEDWAVVDHTRFAIVKTNRPQQW